ncbi:MAG: peptidase M15A [Cyanobacteria bacterium J06638_28]
MAQRSPDQRNEYYWIEATRTGIHKSILAALYAVQGEPPLSDGETGLGIAPANRIPPSQVNTLSEQVHYAANTLRSLINMLTADGWQGKDFWNVIGGHYSDRFLRQVAEGYRPPSTDLLAAQLEPTDADDLIKAYKADWQADAQAARLPENLTATDKLLLAFVEQLPLHYDGLAYQRQALLEGLRIGRKLDTHQAVAIALKVPDQDGCVDEAALDKALLEGIKQAERYFAGYPNQREALIRLVQLWHQLDSREAAMRWLFESPEQPTDWHRNLDAALLAFSQRLVTGYRGRGEQRFALTEGYRCWHHLDSRTQAIQDLGLDPQVLAGNTHEPATMAQAARQIDRALLAFWATVPATYTGTEHEREALMQTVMLWRGMASRLAAVQSLVTDLQQMEHANRDAPEAMPAPPVVATSAPPTCWTPDNLQLGATILPSGSFTWAEATQGGLYLPPDQDTVDAIRRLALLVQEARDRIDRPFSVVAWYYPNGQLLPGKDDTFSRHALGDALTFYCTGITGQQLYWALSPWWPGGLGKFHHYPHLCYVDARNYQVRWTH